MITATPLAMIAVALFATAPVPKVSAAEPLPKGVTMAHLATPLASPTDPVLDGRIWHCEGLDLSGQRQRERPRAVDRARVRGRLAEAGSLR